MKVEILTIGDELLIGQTINTNASWIGEKLTEIGLDVIRQTTISDDRNTILSTLHEATQRAQIIIVTGGLGPTKDDITKQTLCDYFNTKLIHNEAALENVKRIFKMRGRELSQLNIDQALLPEASKIIPNHHGTASGMWFEKDGVYVLSIPGVPYEMKAMMEDDIIPKLIEKFNLKPLPRITILTEGIVESVLAQKIEHWENEIRNEDYALAYLPTPGMVRLRITAPRNKTLNDLREKAEQLKAIISEYVFGEGKETLEELVGELLRKQGKTLSTAESCTGGYIAHLITSVSGSSDYYLGSVVSYANAVKLNTLGVNENDLNNYGAVSQQVVEQMALGVKKLLHTDYAIATSGIAGPLGGTDEKPVGTVWIAIATPNGIASKLFMMGEHRERTIRKTAISALNMLRKELVRG